ncbi:MAG: hypothetical protein ACI9NN_002294 [Bacteroidia bacterium]|jgi:hypothetical protein
MKKKFTLVLSMLLMVGLVYDYNFRMAHTNSSGGPAGNTGSPNDGQTCARAGCHSGPAVANETGVISSDIPAGGYLAGVTYNISVTLTKQGGTKFGFQLSPQGAGGSAIGTLIAGTGSQIVGGNYITHTFAGTSGSGLKTWDFQWTAPASGTADVTFYAAYNFANGSGSSGDVIDTGSLTYSASTVGISEAQLEGITVYPNPVINEIHVASKDVDEEIMITLFDAQGRRVLGNKYAGGTDITIDVNAIGLITGVYFMQLEIDGKSTIKKLMVK